MRILARHSGEAVYRYVGQAPLRTLCADLGLSSASSTHENLGANKKQLLRMIAGLTKRLAKTEDSLQALSSIVQQPRTAVFVQSSSTLAVHQLRCGDSVHTACG